MKGHEESKNAILKEGNKNVDVKYKILHVFVVGEGDNIPFSK